MSQNKYPVYIPNTPEGDDRLKGNPHRKITNEICNIIENQSQNIQRQVIGLEGDWGSGKSNIIKILENNLAKNNLNENKYLHFIFDTWGHQEDLNRRAILEELIDFLEIEDDTLINTEWKKKKKQLTGKTINSEKSSFPEIKVFWILFISSFLLYSFLKNICPFIEEIYLYQGNKLPIIEKLFIFFYLPFLLFIIGLGKLYDEYIVIKNDSENKHLNTANIIGRLFSLIQGKEIKTNTTDFVIENEPSNKIFRDFLDFINERLRVKNKILILTIDNIDRLTTDKIKSLWSTVNIFFADKNDKKYYNNIWLIIPYDEQKILNAFNEDNDPENRIGKGLIEKTFSVKFRVTSPIPSNWELLFEEKLKLAFGNEIIPNFEIDYIKRIFDGFSKEIITPRQIINFVNDLVTIYSTNKEIEFRYLALFVLAKDSIVSEPIKTILEDSYVKEKPVYTLFINDSELQKKMSAITFGVPVEDAEEIIYSKEINAIFRSGNTNELEKFTNNQIAFNNNFFKEFEKLNLNDLGISKQDNLPDILEKIRELNLIGQHQLDTYYWMNLKHKSLKIINSGTTFKLNSLHKKFCEYNIDYGKEILEKLISDNYGTINNSDTETNHINLLDEINLFLTDKTDISIINLKFNLYNNRILEPENSIYLVNLFPKEFKIFNFRFDEDKISKYYFNKNETLDISLLNDDIDEIVKIKSANSYEFKTLIEKLKLEINTISEITIDDLDKFFNCLKKLTVKRPFEDIKIQINVINQYINNYIADNKKIQTLLICFAVPYPESISSYPKINTVFELPFTNKVDVKELSLEIENFISYGDLFKLVVNKKVNYTLIKHLIIEITNNPLLGKLLSSIWVIENFSKINNSIFEDNKEDIKSFYRKLNGWESHITKHLNQSTKEISKIELSIIDFAMTIENDLSKILLLKSNEYLNSLNSIEITTIIKDQITFENLLYKKLNSKNKLDNIFKQKVNALTLNYLYDFASGKVEILTSEFKNLRGLINSFESDKKNTFYKNSLSLLNKNVNIQPNHLNFYIDEILNNNLLSKANYYFLKAFINYSRFEYYINRNYKNIIDAISKTKNNELITLIWNKVKLKHKGNEIKEYAIKKGFNKK